MQASNNQDVSIDEVVVRSGLAARRIADDMSWAEGSIQPLGADAASEQALVGAVLDNVEAVDPAESSYSACTDGRLPVQLTNGEKVPVREQMVGADMVSAFFVAEVLGERFYADTNAPVAERIADVAAFLQENGLLPSSHIACGAAAGFAAILRNIIRFAGNPKYIARLNALLPDGVYDDALHQDILASIKKSLENNAYEGLDGDVFMQAAKDASGDRAIAELKDDGRGVRGHVEEAIVRLQVPGKAVNGARVAEATGGRQVFAVNDTRMERLARLFSRGNDQDYRRASIALEDFADSGHGTLAKNLPTYLITLS